MLKELCSKKSNGYQWEEKHKQTDCINATKSVSGHDPFNLPSVDWKILGVLTSVALFVRLFRLSQPDGVVFDEIQ